MLYIGDFDDPMANNDNVDISKYAIELTPMQCVYLEKLLPGTNYKFQTEDAARSQMKRRLKQKKKQAKSALTDSAISNSDKLSSYDRRGEDYSSIQSKRMPSTPSKAKGPSEPADSFKDNLSKPEKSLEASKPYVPSESADSCKLLFVR